ncbi:chromatin-remodeling ATPase INO80 [Nematocida sp. LUAm3]|nr:chromatin-remodeling ATPase INO80 [Nematocida sp. LUAm3]KAI5175486.1 chromatin-remodeling ATPase INO80 [Nematocida sp. LUAm2]KAI5178484.1 chromatin-remodeling ATPase INO80 [Nematocida sp. LUAm1]
MKALEKEEENSFSVYQMNFHKSLERRRIENLEKKTKRIYESSRRTLQALGFDPERLPEPNMDRHIKQTGFQEILETLKEGKVEENQVSVEEETNKLYEEICKKLISKVHKVFISSISVKQAQHKKISTICQRELKRVLTKTSKTNPILKGKRITKELSLFFKRSERSIREKKRKEEKEDYERRKKEEEQEEERRQERKLNFLITQTELFSHFILGKTQNTEIDEQSKIALEAAEKHKKAVEDFGRPAKKSQEKVSQAVYNNSTLPISEGIKVPSILKCKLKEYQKRGLEWLISLYDQGINGMLADEMGLGKTVQAISFLAHLAKNEGNWGPFLVITPASTLHNWEQEFSKFVSGFKILSYWGGVKERKLQRTHWQQRKLQKEDSPFHVVITSYQLAVTDEKFLNRIKWQYMILDEAQAIKSSSSTRWKTLLSFKARSRLLLTGTPIQNTLQELWALLHFIMPTLFDSHGEFSEWFKIEDGDSITEAARLRMVLQPFMLRREKKDVADELGQKIEKTIICELTPKQKRLYEGIRMRAPMASFLENTLPEEIEGVEGLMNLVMQFRKVCNHPDLFEKKETVSGWQVPKNEIYIPLPLAETIFYSEKRAPKRLCIEEKETPCIFLDRPAKRIKVDPYLSESIIEKLETALIPRCIPPSQRIVSSLSFPVETKTPLEEKFLIGHMPKIYVESVDRFVSESGKLLVLDKLLPKLKEEEHRVLIYFQMTRMMDLFEEYLTVRNYTYQRLDGSSKISERKEAVQKWQSDPSIFIFILSTRAGGLGINLTAADTVIFYDNDWNPTADQQAMDRAHRLGQTKEVTVYRLITKDTIEEKIMEKAGIKGEIQRMVIMTKD